MAIDIRWVSGTAAGGGDGTQGSPWTIYEAMPMINADRRINIQNDATYTLGTALNLSTFDTVAPALNTPGAIVGTDTSGVIQTDPANFPILDFATQPSGDSIVGTYTSLVIMAALRISNSPARGYYTIQDGGVLINLVVDGCTGVGIQVDRSYKIIGCRVSDCAGGIYVGLYSSVYGCDVYNIVGGDGIRAWSNDNDVIGCYVSDVSSASTYGISGGNGHFAHNTIDACLNGINIVSMQSRVGNIFSNNTTAVYSVSSTYSNLLQYANNFYNNTTDKHANVQDELVDYGETAENPTYTDISNDDYNTANTALQAQQIYATVGESDIGAPQGGTPAGTAAASSSIFCYPIR